MLKAAFEAKWLLLGSGSWTWFPLAMLLDKGSYWPPSPGFGPVTGHPLGN